MKDVLLVALVLGLSSAAAAQTSNAGVAGECRLKLSQAPSIRGIHLGMTVNEVLAAFPGAEKNESIRQRLSQATFGSTNANFVPSNYQSKERFVGVSSLDVAFLDGELTSYAFLYNGPIWKTSAQFASKVAEALGLPGIDFWKESAGVAGKALTCDGFQVRLQIMPESGSNVILVRNLEKDANKIVREREEAVKEEARRAFRP